MTRSADRARLATYLILATGSLVMLVPVAWMILSSLKSFDEIAASPPVWLPTSPRWANYLEVLTRFSFIRYFLNSMFVCVMKIGGTLISSMLAAYAFGCLRAPGRNRLFGLLLCAMMLPGQVTIIPMFELHSWLGWINTYYPLIVPNWLGVNVFAIFLLRQFFMTIPRDYIEAARMDGASELHILLNVVAPLSKPALITVIIFSFMSAWNDLWGPLIYLHDESLYTMPIGLLNFIGTAGQGQGSPWQLVMAASVIMMLPIVVLFFVAQRRFIEGLSATGIKG